MVFSIFSIFAAEPAPAKPLTLDGIPPIPGELPEQVGRYTESRAAGFQDWHPTRPEMLITTRFGDTNQIHRIAPLNNAQKIAKPLFVVQGANDPRVPKSEADQI